jgi:hypothetical protein
MDGNGWKPVPPHHYGVFPGNLDTDSYLAEWNHPSRNWAPDLQAVERVDIAALDKRRTGDNRQQPGLLRVNARTNDR